MVLITHKSNKLYIGLDNKLLEYNISDGTSKIIKLPEIIVPPNLSKGQEAVFKRGDNEVTIIVHSNNEEYTVISTENKQVVVFDNSLNVVKNFVLNRAASALAFTPDCNVLVADKTGDAYVYDLKIDSEPTLVLGHLSMLLDILVTNCNKYIITCDRDEKIRVSHYPNSYNIISYCLGHKEFVTNLHIVDNVLISASGDGSIRFWDYKTGKQLHIINTNESVKDKCFIESFCKKMEVDNVEVEAVPITDMQIFKNGSNLYIGVSLFELNNIQIYTVTLNGLNVAMKNVQNITVDKQLIHFSLSSNLFVLTNETIMDYKLNDVYDLVDNKLLNAFYCENTDVFKKCIKDKDVSVLYKRKFDNVQEYMEKKKIRLETK